jgi:hypothetical protein
MSPGKRSPDLDRLMRDPSQTPAGEHPAGLVPRRRIRWRRWILGIVLNTILLLGVALLIPWEYAYVPGGSDVLNPTPRVTDQAFDVWGRSVSQGEANRLLQAEEGRATLSPASGAVRIDGETPRLGHDSYYAATLGNEVFLTDIAPTMSGQVRFSGVGLALLKLGERRRSPLDRLKRLGGGRTRLFRVADDLGLHVRQPGESLDHVAPPAAGADRREDDLFRGRTGPRSPGRERGSRACQPGPVDHVAEEYTLQGRDEPTGEGLAEQPPSDTPQGRTDSEEPEQADEDGRQGNTAPTGQGRMKSGT